jgi:O-acetyl-ADP-ribose deacetylase (regulator of RNase III)
MKPTCFVIMPFGEKEDIDGVTIKFDEIYQDLIEPVITCLQMTAVRCDQVAEAGWIHKDMIKHIHDAEACVVDLTTLNPNVFYELGIRHALRRQVTVLLRRKAVKLPFNIQGLRTIEYDLDYRGITRAKEEIRTFLSNGLAQRKNDSLVYDILPDLRIPPADQPINVKQKILYEIAKYKNRKIGLITGDIRHIDGIDIWVNSENTNMQMARFFDRSICGVIRYLGARKDDTGLVVDDLIADQLNAIVKQKTVPPGTVICTDPGELARSHGVVAIMHVAAVTGQLGFGYCPVADLGECVRNVLYRVDQTEELRKTPKSILFPLLGTGTAKGNPEELVPPQIGAAVAYLEDRASTAIETVWFLVHTIKHFEICTDILADMSSRCRPFSDVA